MRIAVLGWGSLIWNPAKLKIREPFRQTGPILPIEFARISGNGRLTLVIDERHGERCETFYAISSFDNLDDARDNLRDREGMTHVNGVGFVDLPHDVVSERALERHPNAVPIVREWAAQHDFDAVIWTALAPNFAEMQSVEFSVDAAMIYLKALPSEKFALAEDYIRKAPKTVRTPLRAAFFDVWPDL
ncbi:hypothetical protein [Rhizobium leguminosarum]|uniref:hypothetical protein n=1 Tax=Rhizobium leguminosarum TaxID=384 RepID=UPI00037EA899|nr:hypothetical protein [Rhizobium leguminosarum]